VDKPWKDDPAPDDEPWEHRGPWAWTGSWEDGHKVKWEDSRKYHRHAPWPHPPRRPWTHHYRTHAGWRKEWRRNRVPLFFRLAGAFGIMALLVLGGMGAIAFILTRLFGGEAQAAALVWMGGCGLSLALPLLAGALALQIYRGVATPLSDVMSAADAVAEGDLSTRVPTSTRGPGDFRRLVRSFNRMVEELERADQQRRNLTADVAHELRTPLHIIQGNLEGILDQVYEPTPEHIDATLDETRALARLVDDLRTLSLAEAGQLPLVRELVDVSELLTDVQTSFSGQAEAAGLDLRVKTGQDVSTATVFADVGRLDQVLSNLVANALRHTAAGGTITLRAESDKETVRIAVSDTGEGIPAEDLPFIFDRFWRGDRSRSRLAGAGSGLGLAIARQLVQAHGGRIHAESELGQGTTITIELPAAASVES
jgi:signal transduction histidine kinase